MFSCNYVTIIHLVNLSGMILPDYLLDEEEIDAEEEEGNKVVSNLGLDEKIFNQAIRFILFIEMIF